MPALMYRSHQGHVISTGNTSYIIDHGELRPDVGSNGRFFLSNAGVGIYPLVLIGSYREILDYLSSHSDIEVVNQTEFNAGEIYVSAAVFRSGSARFESVSARNTAINSIVGFATGSVVPGLMPVAGTASHVTAGVAGSISELVSAVARVVTGPANSSTRASVSNDDIGQGQTFAVRFSQYESQKKFSFSVGEGTGTTSLGDLRIPVQITIQQVLGL